MKQIEVRTASRRQMVNITTQIKEAVREADVAAGLCHVYVPHTTAAVVINESADPDVVRDLLACYDRLVPDIRFAHAEGNSDAHYLTTVLGSAVLLPIDGGALCLGTWQGVFFVELDGPRTRRVWVTVSG